MLRKILISSFFMISAIGNCQEQKTDTVFDIANLDCSFGPSSVASWYWEKTLNHGAFLQGRVQVSRRLKINGSFTYMLPFPEPHYENKLREQHYDIGLTYEFLYNKSWLAYVFAGIDFDHYKGVYLGGDSTLDKFLDPGDVDKYTYISPLLGLGLERRIPSSSISFFGEIKSAPLNYLLCLNAGIRFSNKPYRPINHPAKESIISFSAGGQIFIRDSYGPTTYHRRGFNARVFAQLYKRLRTSVGFTFFPSYWDGYASYKDTYIDVDLNFFYLKMQRLGMYALFGGTFDHVIASSDANPWIDIYSTYGLGAEVLLFGEFSLFGEYKGCLIAPFDPDYKAIDQLVCAGIKLDI